MIKSFRPDGKYAVRSVKEMYRGHVPASQTKFERLTSITPVYDNISQASYYDRWNNKIRVGVDPDISSDYRTTLGEVTAHELAHTRALYRDPEYLRKRHLKWLTPHNPENDHDASISESYADLMGLRTNLFNDKIVDGRVQRYKNKHIREYNRLHGSEGNRYLGLHPNINRVRKALNRIYKNGGKISQ